MRLKGEGVPELHSGVRGDLIARIRVWTPRKLSREQREALQRLAEVEDAPPARVEEEPDGLRGLWSKVREAFTG
jgi:molecular chaperone DnaJ